MTAVRRELNRLVEKKDILNLRKGFYLIIPPRFSLAQKLPVQLYSEKLFSFLHRNYYIGLFSAARIYGASHQQIQRDYLIIERPKLISINKKNFALQFYTTANWPKNNIEIRKADAGNYRISSPALTFVDLIHHHTRIGGLNRILAILEELTEELDAHDIESLIGWYKNRSTLQRAGFIMEEILGPNNYADQIYQNLSQRPLYSILLSHNSNKKPGSVNNRWKVDVNLKLQSDI